MRIFGFNFFGTSGTDTGSPIADLEVDAGVNPATGLPMLEDSAIDAAGNVFGMGEPGGADGFDFSSCGGDDFGCDF